MVYRVQSNIMLRQKGRFTDFSFPDQLLKIEFFSSRLAGQEIEFFFGLKLILIICCCPCAFWMLHVFLKLLILRSWLSRIVYIGPSNCYLRQGRSTVWSQSLPATRLDNVASYELALRKTLLFSFWSSRESVLVFGFFRGVWIVRAPCAPPADVDAGLADEDAAGLVVTATSKSTA